MPDHPNCHGLTRTGRRSCVRCSSSPLFSLHVSLSTVCLQRHSESINCARCLDSVRSRQYAVCRFSRFTLGCVALFGRHVGLPLQSRSYLRCAHDMTLCLHACPASPPDKSHAKFSTRRFGPDEHDTTSSSIRTPPASSEVDG